MKVTKVKINSCTPKEYGICASVTVYLDNSLVIHQVHVINGKGVLFVAFPNTGNIRTKKEEDGSVKRRYMDIVHTCSEKLRLEITNKVLECYNANISK